MNSKTVLLAFMILGLVVLAGCGSSGPSIIVQITNAPATLTVNQTVSLSATVSNDTQAGNVNWTCSPSSSCGTFNPTTSTNGGTTMYTAPGSTGTVTITATDADHTSSTATATISIVPIGTNSSVKGNYVFFVEGTDSTGTYVAVGTIVADGNGNITSGEQDYVDQGGTEAGPDTVTGTYTVGTNGAGSITLNVSDIRLPNNGVETFSFALTSSTHGLIIQFDSTATSSGTLDFQAASGTNASSIAGSYSFTLNGLDIVNEVPAAFGGTANLSAATGNITSGTFYANDGGTTQTSNVLNGPITGPDQFGRGTMATSDGFHYVFYAVQGEVLRVIDTDVPDFLAGGAFYGQGTTGASSTFSDLTLKGTYTFFESGTSVSGPLSLVGQFTSDGTGDFSAGFADTNNYGTYSRGSIAGQGVYSIPGNGDGTMTLPGTSSTTQYVSDLLIFATDPALNLYDPNNTSGGGGALILDFDSNAVGTGLIVPQTIGTFQGNYAVNLQFYNSIGEEDFVGQSVASNSALTGTVDLNDSGVTAPGTSFSGSFTADTTNVGRYTGTFTVGANHFNITYYQVTSGEFFILDTDSGDVGNGFMETE